MSETDEDPLPDQAPGAPHPRAAARLFGQDAAEAAFLQAFHSGRLHHGWLLCGPRGVGKATLAWRIARFLLASPGPAAEDGLFGAPPPPATLAIDPEHPVARRIAARSEPGLASVTRSLGDTGRLRNEIVAEDIRALNHFFGLSAAEGGRRVVIIDSADEMNPTAANALLKMLEEPPRGAVLLLISHQPSRLLPTIRSRCRTLRLSPLGPADLAAALDQAGLTATDDPTHLATLAAGSVGQAMRLAALGGVGLYAELVALAGSMPRTDRQRALALAERAAQRGGAERFELMLDLIDTLLLRLARTGATGTPPSPEAAPEEARVLAALSDSPARARAWADTAAAIRARSRHGKAVNLDPAALVLDTVFKMQETAAG